MFKSGKTLNAIGEAYGVSRERVRQIIKKQHGLVGTDGGKTASAEQARQRRIAKKDARSFEKHGCSYAQYLDLMRPGEGKRCKTPTGAFIQQRRSANARGIPWNIKLWEWWQVWVQSGKWEVRGRMKGNYVMCRFNDEGPYEVGNVYIATSSHNTSFQPNNPYRSTHPDHQKMVQDLYKIRPRKARKTRDLPLGVSFHKGRFIAQISINRKNIYLGRFGTPEEAHAAYLRAAAASDIRVAA